MLSFNQYKTKFLEKLESNQKVDLSLLLSFLEILLNGLYLSGCLDRSRKVTEEAISIEAEQINNNGFNHVCVFSVNKFKNNSSLVILYQ